MSVIALRDLAGMAEFLEAQSLQRAVWGEDDLVDPGDLMMVIQAEGGLCAGAFDDDRLIGYVFGFPTQDPAIQHSHRLAVLPEARGTGLGVRLKWYQRDWCLARGISLVRWTFDPLRLPNANLNIRTLGATARTYYPDYYGKMMGLNAGVPSDRLLADWHLSRPAVVSRATGWPQPLPEAEVAARVRIPRDFAGMLTGAADEALAERLRVRAEITDALAQGQEIVGFDPAACAYLLSARND